MATSLPVFGRSKAIDDLAANTTAEAAPTSVLIEEVNTPTWRRLLLSGRCLPLRGVTDTMTQRYSKRLNPGATEATIQVLGPDPKDQTIRGHFRARYMDGDSLIYREVGREDEAIHTPERARQVLFAMCKVGQLVRVSRGQQDVSVVQRGIIAEVRCDEDRPQDIHWEIRFEWLADGDFTPQPLITPDPPSAKSLRDKVQGVVDTVNTVLDEAEGAYQEYVVQTLNTVNNVLSEASDLVERAFDLAARPADLSRNLAVTAGNVKQTIVDTQTQAIALAARYANIAADWQALGRNCAFAPWNHTRERPGDDVEGHATSTISAMDFDLSCRRAQAAARRLAIQAMENPESEIRDVYPVKEGDSLRRVSTHYYGTPDNWDKIADATGLIGEVQLTAGMVLIIPEVV